MFWILYIAISFFMGAVFYQIAKPKIEPNECFIMGFFFPVVILMGLGLWVGEKLANKI